MKSFNQSILFVRKIKTHTENLKLGVRIKFTRKFTHLIIKMNLTFEVISKKKKETNNGLKDLEILDNVFKLFEP